MQAKLKLSNNRLKIVPDLLMNYNDHLIKELVAFGASDKIYFQLSICADLIERTNKLAISRYPAKISQLKLKLHEVILMYDAFKFHELNTDNDYTRNVARDLSGDLHKQKPSTIQLLTQFK